MAVVSALVLENASACLVGPELIVELAMVAVLQIRRHFHFSVCRHVRLCQTANPAHPEVTALCVKQHVAAFTLLMPARAIALCCLLARPLQLCLHSISLLQWLTMHAKF